MRLGIYTKFKDIILTRICSEIGVYSWSLSEGDQIEASGVGDYLVRSKMYGVDEGGICTGFAFVDSFEVE